MTQAFLKHGGMEKIQYLSLSRAINDNLSGYYNSLKESEIVYKNEERWMDITSFIDYMLNVIEKCMLTALKEDNELAEKQKLLLSKM